ncbi:hypothetical protein JR316_0004950 [Psilocybe cubensis]|uniref:Uncharacterized protein n=2 Tax=Psilocybe cubensis TaxID=181762 RepID=A0A8H8CL32_PSICU|nr:hypothetical protein JR316_0004950 [Psilocybe cubensis]KAH9482850.1 hypothetical protein JR316_0004950 [Psilocybe cubensis]
MPSTHYLLAGLRACRSSLQNPSKRPSSARCYATTTPKSRHGSFYSDTLPAMIPVFLLGSAVFLGLQLTQLKLSHEKFIDEATARVAELEAEIEALQQQRASETQTSSQAEPEAPTSRWRWW